MAKRPKPDTQTPPEPGVTPAQAPHTAAAATHDPAGKPETPKKPEKPRQRRRQGTLLTADTPLLPKEQAFVGFYMLAFNGAEAARQAGYAELSARTTASQLLTKPNVKAALVAARDRLEERTGITAARVAGDIDKAANLDVGELLDSEGALLPIRLMPAHVRRCIVSFEVAKRKAWGRTYEHVHKVKLMDKAKMHEILARYTGVDKGEGAQAATEVPAFALPADTPGVSVH